MSVEPTETAGSDADRPGAVAPSPDTEDAAASDPSTAGVTAVSVPRHAASAPDAPWRGNPRSRGERPLWLAVLINVAVALVVVSLAQAFLVRVHAVSSGSMRQTLAVTDRVLSSKLPYLGGGPARGDIVIFAHGETWDSPVRRPDPNPLKQAARWFGDLTGIGISDYFYTVKRVIGVGGDEVACCDLQGRVSVNGAPLAEPYVFEDLPYVPGSMDCATVPRSSRCFGPIKVPDGQLLVMGDHRSNSADSVAGCRSQDAASDCAKFVENGRVSGKVIARAWPPGPIG